MSKDYRIVAKVRNNRILSLIEAAGFSSTNAFCKARGLSMSGVCALIAMTDSPLNQRREWRKLAVDLATALGVQPEEMFNARQKMGGNATTIVREVSETELSLESTTIADRLLPSPDAAVTAKVDVDRMLDCLSPRYRKVVEMHYGLNGQGEATLKEVGDEIGVSVERVRQMVAKAFRKIRHPAISGAGYRLNG